MWLFISNRPDASRLDTPPECGVPALSPRNLSIIRLNPAAGEPHTGPIGRPGQTTGAEMKEA